MGTFLYPLPDEYYNKNDSSHWHGAATYNGHGRGKLDFVATAGTEVKSMTAGTVTGAGIYSDGNTYVSIHPTGLNNMSTDYEIRYLHLDDISVSTGDTVSQGDVIGVVEEDHLHLDFIEAGTTNTLLNGFLTYDQLNDDQKEAFDLWLEQAWGIDLSNFSSSSKKGGDGGSNGNNGHGWGRCWEVMATAATWKGSTTSVTGSSDVENAVINKLAEYGCTDAQIAGICGNIQQESSFNPYASNGSFGGLFQISGYTPSNTGDEVADAITQVEYFVEDLNGGWNGASNYFSLAQSNGSKTSSGTTGYSNLIGDSGLTEAEAQADLFLAFCERATTANDTESISSIPYSLVSKYYYSNGNPYGNHYQDVENRRAYAKQFINN